MDRYMHIARLTLSTFIENIYDTLHDYTSCIHQYASSLIDNLQYNLKYKKYKQIEHIQMKNSNNKNVLKNI